MQYKPILKLTPPSKEQLPAVLSDASRIIVTAGAGTGKTRTLVARYLALLANGVPMRSIVAITFTRKAAREMRNRVRHENRELCRLPRSARGRLSNVLHGWLTIVKSMARTSAPFMHCAA